MLLGYSVGFDDRVVTTMGGVLLPPPQAIRIPKSISATNRPAAAECRDTLRPAKPTMTMPARGNANGSQGERLSARRRWPAPWPAPGVAGPGPAVAICSVTWVNPLVAGIMLFTIPVPEKVQLVAVSVGSLGLKLLQLRVTGAPKLVAGDAGATEKA